MYYFIAVLRALAAVIITNAHYGNVYPLAIFANGGLLGDVLFFVVSGFCLAVPRQRFDRWYFKRLKRLYPPVILISLIYTGLGFYSAHTWNAAVRLFLYPTKFHFVASILVLYIVYYVCVRVMFAVTQNEKQLFGWLFGIVLILHFTVYVFFYDKSRYHIDSVYEPMIRFLFFEAMLMGGYVRGNCEKIMRAPTGKYGLWALPLMITYFGSKMLFVKYAVFSQFQILNQFILLALSAAVFCTACSMESAIRRMPAKTFGVFRYLSSITLEIYVVQYVLIRVCNVGPFPLNFVAVTASILLAAIALHHLSEAAVKGLSLLFNVRNRK